MSSDEIMSEVHRRLEIPRVQEWFLAADASIRPTITAVARVDGIDAAIRDTRELYVSWLAQAAAPE